MSVQYDRMDGFINQAAGNAYAFGFGVQCVALIQEAVQVVFELPWTETLGYGNACDLFDGASSEYFDKIENDPNDPDQNPQRGDIVCVSAYHNPWGWYSDYGHIFICTGPATSSGIPSIEQDGYHQWKGCYTVLNDWNEFTHEDGSNAVIGWLRPKGYDEPVEFPPVSVDSRPVAKIGCVFYRVPGCDENQRNYTTTPGEHLNLTEEFICGDTIRGNHVWLKGEGGDFCPADTVDGVDLTQFRDVTDYLSRDGVLRAYQHLNQIVGVESDSDGNRTDDDVEKFKRVLRQDGRPYVSDGPTFDQGDLAQLGSDMIRMDQKGGEWISWLTNERHGYLGIRAR